MRAFVMMRQYLASQDELRRKLAALERRLTEHDVHFKTVFDAIRELMKPRLKPRRRIGFTHGSARELGRF